MKSPRDFKKVYENGKSIANRYLVMYIYENGTEENRIGISVSKKVGNSVIRHRTTRLIRESVRLNEDTVKKGYDIVIVARMMVKGKGFKDVESAYLHLIKLHKLAIEESERSL